MMSTSKKQQLIERFSSIEDPRCSGRCLYALTEILFLSICAVLAGADGPTEIEIFGKQRLNWLRKFADFASGIPSHDTIGRLFSLIKPAIFQEVFLQWILDFFPETMPEYTAKEMQIAIDGKTLRGSGKRSEEVNTLHLVSAWSIAHQATLGQRAVSQKSNEITAIPPLLRALELSGAIVSIDAMGCQTEIAETIIAGDGDYVLAVKANQPRLHEAVTAAFTALHNQEIFASDGISHQTEESGHGRHEVRCYELIAVPAEMVELRQRWPGLKSIGQATSIVERKGVETVDIRYYISSLDGDVERFARIVRQHWHIENKLHWVLDMIFSEDASPIHVQTAAENFGFLRRFALSLLKQEPSKGSLKGKRKRAGWNTDFLESLLFP